MLLLIPCTQVFGQLTNVRTKIIASSSDTIQLDSLSIYPTSFELSCDDTPFDYTNYSIDYAKAQLILKQKCDGIMKVKYRVFPINFSTSYSERDTSIIYERIKGDREKFLFTSTVQTQDLFSSSGVKKSGSISRGITFGNNQDLGVNSSLNLELIGDISPNLKLLASVSDDNIPIQPDGNTNKLQEFDQVFIQVYNDDLKLIAGDFWIAKPKGYFMTYKKRAQGLTGSYQWDRDSLHHWTTQASGALSKGKFQRQIIQGIEGNQGPYRLRGAENELFILILAGTERVYIDGRLLERGQEFDYVIDYNTSEVTFTSRNQITKDSRIVVEFQYSDQNYARSLFQSATTYSSPKFDFWLNGYSEQDAKNQSLQQDLSQGQKQFLSEIGDSLFLARISSIDSIGYFDNQQLYSLTDTIVSGVYYDSILVYSVNPDEAFYKATFQYVGPNNGNYMLDGYNALGKVYKWVVPIGGIPQGDYAPSRIVITPKQRQMVTSGFTYRMNKVIQLETELAYTNYDINTFSRKDAADDQSFGGKTKLTSMIPFGRDSIQKWQLLGTAELEVRDRYFQPIEQYRAVEFDRDWNTRNKGYEGNQVIATLGSRFKHASNGFLDVNGQHFLIGSDYQGTKGAFDGRWNQKGFKANWTSSFLTSDAETTNTYARHKADISQNIKWIKIGYKDDHELNQFRTDSSLQGNSYQFFDYQFYIANGDSIKNHYRLFYRERFDDISNGDRLLRAAKAQTAGGEIKITEWKNHKLNVITSFRELKILNDTLISQQPERSLLGRVDYEFRLWKNALTWNTFYEVGSGLEQKREFLYLQVNDGQGIYTWIDYNNDGIKDLNEFEIAQYVDQASYIRVFTPSNDYIRTYSNEFNQSIFFRPERLWANKKGVLKFMSRFSDQARVRIRRKTNNFDQEQAFNPFVGEIRDTSLISTSYNLRNTFYFNRSSNVFGMDWTYQDSRNKTALASGFDSRSNTFHELQARWNLSKIFTLQNSVQVGNKSSIADYTSGRNFEISYFAIKPSFIYQPNTKFRISLDARYSEKHNSIDYGNEDAFIGELGTTFKYNQAEKGSLQGEFKMINITYTGNVNSALGFEMLEALKPGVNYTWNIGYQRLVSKNLQLSLQYNGRKSQANKMIHSAGMEIRAFF